MRMLIQHILTAEIFDTIFGSSHFHRENNIARELETVINTFFVGKVRHDTLSTIDNYYKAIKKLSLFSLEISTRPWQPLS